MADSDQNLDQRIKDLEGKLDFALRRIDELEKAAGRTSEQPKPAAPTQAAAPAPVEPPKPVSAPVPPVIAAQQRPAPVPPERVEPAKVEPVKAEPPKIDPPKYDPPKYDPPKPKQPSAPKKSIEYNIGAKVLPWAGALIVIAAIGFMIAIGVDRHWFPPQLQFAGLIALSAAFIGVGFWKRNEREDFGKILIGIGSCGMFLSFVGGHAYHHLYDWTTLMTLFMGWSVVNLAFCVVLKSRAILTIAIFGGMIAALMPLRLHDYNLSLLLNFGIALPAVVISVWRRWPPLLWISWAATFLCLLPPAFLNTDWRIGAAAIAIQAAIHCLANFIVFEEGSFDTDGYLSSATIGVGGITLICLRHDLGAGIAIAIFAAVCLAICYRFKGRPSFRTAALTAIGVGVIIAPLCLPAFYAVVAYSVLSIVFAAILMFAKKKEAMAFTWIEFGLAGSLYLFQQSGYSSVFELNNARQVSWQMDAILLALVTLSLLSASWASAKYTEKSETVFALASTLIIPIALRGTMLYSIGSQTRTEGWLTSSILLFTAGSFAVAYTCGRKWMTGAIFAWINLAVATTCYMFLRSIPGIHSYSWEVDASLLGFIVLVLWANASVLGKAYDKLETAVNLAAVVSIPALLRGSYIFHLAVGGHVVNYYTTACIAFLFQSVLMVTFAGKKWSTSTVIGWMIYVVSLIAFAAAHSAFDAPLFVLDAGRESLLLVSLLAAGLINCWRSAVNHEQPQAFFNIGSLLIFPILVRGGFLYGKVSGSDLTTTYMIAAIAVTALSIGVNHFGGRKWLSANVVAWAFTFVSVIGYGIYFLGPRTGRFGDSQNTLLELATLVSRSHTPVFNELPVIVAVLCAIGYGYIVTNRHLSEDGEPVFDVVLTVIGSAFIGRILIILGHPLFPNVHDLVILSSAMAMVGLACNALYLKWKNVGLLFSAWIWAAIGGVTYLTLSMEHHLLVPTLMLFGLSIWCTANSFKFENSEPVTTVAGMFGGLCLFVDLTLQIFSRSFNDPRASWIIAGAFSAYAGLLLTTGMLLKRMLLRWGSLILLGGTVAKVLLIDLTNAIDPVLRVVILFVLGMVLLGGGYLYIRTRTGIEKADSEEVSEPANEE